MDIEKEIADIKTRNSRVETDKAWEISWTRRITIALITYIVALIWLMIIHEPVAALKACVPVAGYVLSTLSLPIVKNIWSAKNRG